MRGSWLSGGYRYGAADGGSLGSAPRWPYTW